MTAASGIKFSFLESIDRFLQGSAGFSVQLADLITFLIACAILLLLIWILKLFGSRMVSGLIRLAVKHTGVKWNEFLIRNKFYSKFIRLIAASIVLGTTQTLFRGFSLPLQKTADIAITIYLIYTFLQVFNAIMSTVNDVYETKPQAKYKSIRSIIQSFKIAAAIIAFVMIISVFFSVEPRQFLAPLLGSAAIISLIFRDVILGFVASIQISAQEMIRPGDWIEMPSRGADGMVSEINVTNIKVQNWDNSVSMIPTYAMVSESFTNWRNMLESQGRRFRRPLLVDINSVAVISPRQSEKIMLHPALGQNATAKMREFIRQGNTSDFITNVGLYRCYIEAYLHNHPRIAQNQMRVVRYLDNSENGITIQVYAFTKEKMLIDYERVVADIFEHITVVASVFSLKLYQRPLSSSEGDPMAMYGDPQPDAPPAES